MDIFVRSDLNYNSPFGGAGFLKICVYKNMVSNGEDLYQTLVNAIPGLDTSSKKDTNSLQKMEDAYNKFEEALKKEFSNDKKAFDNTSTPLDTYYLPLPNSISERYSQSFEASSFNIDNAIMAAGLSKAMGTTSNVSETAGAMVTDIVEMTKHLGARGNASIDPNLINVYISSLPRSFTFNLDIVPQNTDEVINTLNIITRMYKYSLGIKSRVKVNKLDLGIIKSGSVYTMEYYMFTKNGDFVVNPYLSNMLNTNLDSSGFFLSDLEIDLGQSSNVQLFDADGDITYDKDNNFYTLSNGSSFKVPKIINISMTFTEYKPLYANDWDEIVTKIKDGVVE